MNHLISSLLLCLAALFCASHSLAQDVLKVPPLSAQVIDQTGTLSPAQTAELTVKLATLEQQSGTQMVVLLVPTTAPEDIASYAQRVADQWKIGRRDVGDGVVIIVAKGDRRVRIEVAKTLEGAVPDLAAKRIISEQVGPAFKTGDYAGGLNAAVDALTLRIKGEGLAEPSPRAQRGGSAGSGSGGLGADWQPLAMFFFIGVPVIGGFLTRVFGRKLGSLVTGGVAGGMGWLLTASGLLAGIAGVVALVLVGILGFGAAGSLVGASRRGGFGGGPAIWGGGGGGFGGGGGGGGAGGGFSSGGGGDFGGGGASGDW